MAVIQVGGSSHRGRALDHDLPLLPFIDFMLCLVAFLMLTAAWSQMGRLQAEANGSSGASEEQRRPTVLHLTVKENAFDLAWRDGETVIDTQQVPRKATFAGDQSPHYPELAASLETSWKAHGTHRAASDIAQDRAVIHVANSLDFSEMSAVMDALAAPTRRVEQGARAGKIAAFAVSLAAD
jgi:biopolymer transport protein ExbD